MGFQGGRIDALNETILADKITVFTVYEKGNSSRSKRCFCKFRSRITRDYIVTATKNYTSPSIESKRCVNLPKLVKTIALTIRSLDPSLFAQLIVGFRSIDEISNTINRQTKSSQSTCFTIPAQPNLQELSSCYRWFADNIFLKCHRL